MYNECYNVWVLQVAYYIIDGVIDQTYGDPSASTWCQPRQDGVKKAKHFKEQI